jgi:hypothetical protein
MRAISRLVLVAALILGLSPVTASAQRWTADFGVNGGWAWYSNMVRDGDAGTFNNLRFDNGWITGAQLTVNPWERLGLRANMSYAERPIVSDQGDLFGIGTTGQNVSTTTFNLWSGSIDALIRFRAPNETWQGSEVLPYLALGGGLKWINPAGDRYVCRDQTVNPAVQLECEPVRLGAAVTNGTTENNVVAIAEESTFMGLAGLGADVRLSPRVGLRFEGTARFYRPEIYRAQWTTGTAPGNDGQLGVLALPAGTETAGRWVTELAATGGLHFMFGLRQPPPVAVAPLPPAPPPPPPPPAPEAPREDAVMICVIDPTAMGGVRMQAATFRHAQGDTVVMVDGQARALRQAVGQGVMTARDAGWYVRGEPLALTIGRETVRWLPYQTAVQIQPERIVYIGNVQGYPVYADRDEIADVLPALQTARGTRTDAELGTLLAGVDTRTRDVVQRAAFLYVPLDPVGCVFQPVQRVDDVRKGK